MSNEDNKSSMPQSSLWSSSETAEHWQQDVERRRRDMAEKATRRMLETAGLSREIMSLTLGRALGTRL